MRAEVRKLRLSPPQRGELARSDSMLLLSVMTYIRLSDELRSTKDELLRVGQEFGLEGRNFHGGGTAPK